MNRLQQTNKRVLEATVGKMCREKRQMIQQQLDELDATNNNDNAMAVAEEPDALYALAAVVSEASESAGIHEGGA